MCTITSGRGTYSYSWQVINKKLKSFKIILSVISLVYRLTVYFLLDTKNDNHKTYRQYPVISRFEQCIKAFKNHWFNKQYNLNAVKADLAELFQWCCHHKAVIWGKLAAYEYVNDGVVVNSPLGLLYDNWRRFLWTVPEGSGIPKLDFWILQTSENIIMDWMPNAEKFEIILSQRQTTVILHFPSWQRRLFEMFSA